jgi:hypothetical protein
MVLPYPGLEPPDFSDMQMRNGVPIEDIDEQSLVRWVIPSQHLSLLSSAAERR